MGVGGRSQLRGSAEIAGLQNVVGGGDVMVVGGGDMMVVGGGDVMVGGGGDGGGGDGRGGVPVMVVLVLGLLRRVAVPWWP